MTDRTISALNWVLAGMTALAWFSTYAVFVMNDRESRRRLELSLWRLRQRFRFRRRGPRAVPPRLLRPRPPAVSGLAPPRAPASIPAGRTATARAIAVAEPAVRIAEWRADNLPLRYRLLGRVRRGANDN